MYAIRSYYDEEGRIDHGTMFWHAAKEGLVDPAHSVQIGLRTTNDDTLGFNIFDGPFVHREGIDVVVAETRKILGDRPVYLSFDIDCLRITSYNVCYTKLLRFFT